MILGAIESNPGFALDETDLREDASGYTADLSAAPRVEVSRCAASPSSSAPIRSSMPTGFDSTKSSAHSSVLRSHRAPASVPTRWRALLPRFRRSLRERIASLNLPEIPESASFVRTLIAQRRSIRYLVPEPVWHYIVAHRLYGLSDDA